jgi:ABC-type lipoprotein export system ATPase subunit
MAKKQQVKGANFVAQQIGDEFVIRINLKKVVGPSGSGKTTVVATTRGNIPILNDGQTVMGLNIFRYPQAKK